MVPMGAKALAEENDTYTITIQNAGNHTYEAYQIFSGRLDMLEVNDGTSTPVLTDILWGEGVNGAQLLQALQKQAEFVNCNSAADVSKVLSDENTNEQLAKKFAKLAGQHLKNPTGTFSSGKPSTISNLKAGYYLIKDQEGSVQGHEAYTDFVLRVVKNTQFTPKTTKVPSVSKKVKENSNQSWGKRADDSIGSAVSFQLIGTLPDHLENYETYQYVFHDTLSKGMEFQPDTVRVYVKNDGTDTEVAKANYQVLTTGLSDSCTFEIRFDNLKQVSGLDSGSQIVVEYAATLTEDAVIAGAGNPNEVYLEFSNNPNGAQTGKTPKDQVVVFTYELVVNKKDEKDHVLSGAAFSLYQKKESQWTLVKSIEAGETTSFRFKGLDAGQYKLVETKAPAGYNKVEDLIFTIRAVYEERQEVLLKSIQIVDEEGRDISTSDGIFRVNLRPDPNNHNIVTDVINKKGSTLPQTGGRGTKGLYAVGGLLIVVALIGFIKKRKHK